MCIKTGIDITNDDFSKKGRLSCGKLKKGAFEKTGKMFYKIALYGSETCSLRKEGGGCQPSKCGSEGALKRSARRKE